MYALFAPESAQQLEAILKQKKPFNDEVLRVQIGGREGWWSISGQPTADGGWRGVCSDITRSRDAEARIAYVTEYDGLTDLANRAMLVRQLEVAQEAAEMRGEGFALFVIDLDNFKALNDTQGHPAGDAFLKVVAQRLRDCVGPTAFLARLGGDEFAIMQRDMLVEEAGELADVIIDALLAPVATQRQGHPGERQRRRRNGPRTRHGPCRPDEERRARTLSRQGPGPRVRALLRGGHGRSRPRPR